MLLSMLLILRNIIIYITLWMNLLGIIKISSTLKFAFLNISKEQNFKIDLITVALLTFFCYYNYPFHVSLEFIWNYIIHYV